MDNVTIIDMIMRLKAGANGQHDDLGVMSDAADLIVELYDENIRVGKTEARTWGQLNDAIKYYKTARWYFGLTLVLFIFNVTLAVQG